MDTLSGFERAVLGAASDARRDNALLLLSVFRKRALSTMTALHVSLERRLAWIGRGQNQVSGSLDWIQPRLDLDDREDEEEDAGFGGLTSEIELAGGVERVWLERLRGLAALALRDQRKVDWIVRLARRAREPVVIFTEFRHSLEELERRLVKHRAVAVLHGGQSEAERRTGLARFQSGDAGVLLATDVASQGLNLQERARWVVSVELPWNPSRLEQRIGRVDRIGQKRTVHATLLVNRHRIEEQLLARLASRVWIANRALGVAAVEGDILPAERAVAEALLQEGEPSLESPPRLLTSSAWRRAARACARQLVRRRSLARQWRTRADTGSRSCWTSAGRWPALAALKSGPMLVVSVPVVDGNGLVVERRMLCLVLPHGTRRSVMALARSDRLRAFLTARLRHRVARLQRIARAQAERRVLAEQAIAGHLHSVVWPAEAQPGLFDRGDARAFDRARAEAHEIDQEIAGRTRRCLATAELELGVPAVEAILFRRR